MQLALPPMVVVCSIGTCDLELNHQMDGGVCDYVCQVTQQPRDAFFPFRPFHCLMRMNAGMNDLTCTHVMHIVGMRQ